LETLVCQNKTPKQNTHTSVGYEYMESMQSSSQSTTKNRDNRCRQNENVINFKRAYEETKSARAAAKLTGQARSTAQYHAKRQRDEDSELSGFFRSAPGLAFLHQLVLSIEFVLSQLSHGGLRLIKKIYELSGLDRWVACSLGTLSQRIRQMENHLIAYGEAQETRLVAQMTQDQVISCALDETFPSGICLVGIEPVSNFILLEEMAAKRDAATWTKAMDQRLAQLPVKVIQVTSDEARALVKYTEQHLNAHHSPDLFHVQQDVSKASAAPLRAKIKKATSVTEQTQEALNTLKEQQIEVESLERKPVGRPVDYASRIIEAETALELAQEAQKEAEGWRDHVRKANRSLGEHYHPFDIQTGRKTTPSTLRRELDKAFDTIETTLEEADLSENSLKRAAKARRMTGAMVDTLRFFWTFVYNQIKTLTLDGALKSVFIELLLPAIYLELHAAKAETAALRKQRKAVSEQLFGQLENAPPWQSMTKEQQQNLHRAATRCAQIFQRSSSNVEGRNGQLSLHHHIYKTMNKRKLKAATVVHNYFIRRPDGTTAAERFFGNAPTSLFDHLVSVTDYPAAPARVRSNVRKMAKAA
jgi:hypothetical protein